MNDNESAIEANFTRLAGTDTANSLMISAIVVTLLQRGAIGAAELRENIDIVLLGLERGAPQSGSLPKVFAHAREQLQTTIDMLDAVMGKSIDAAGAGPAAGFTTFS
ncbi:hypothetical protein [Novosphingobium sp. FSW06-99]|uniref:hypothetical protein n=1 Tax=Novosphingobium sp. FSW06-99 TaxID=1739113 RepID=UPI00076DDA48|nr:hypothetical protein [Novosphingobium sp. FSW06-99]KUR73857.1 hypothetical protein AQZ49_19855 [Novosphingobium sp. FSW06-99]